MPFTRSTVSRDDQDAALGRMTLEFLKKSKYWLLAGAILGGSVGFGASFLIRPQWEATTLLQVGQIAGEEGASASLLEPPARAVDRMKSTQFLEAVISGLAIRRSENEVNPEAELILKSTNVAQMRNSDLLQVSVHGYSGEQARTAINGIASEIASVHATVAKPTIDRLKDEQAAVEQSLSAEEGRKSELQKLAQKEFGGDVARKFSEGVLLTHLLTENDAAVRQLQRRQRALKEQLDPARTFGTHALGPADVSPRAVFPRKSPFVGAGILAGLALTVMLLLIQWSRRHRE